MKRRAFIAGLTGAAAWPLVARAQQSSGLRRISVLQGIGDDPQAEARKRAFLDGLQQLGWTDGVNVKFEMRSSNAGDADSARKYAAELVSLAPDVIVTFGSSSVAALQRVTRTYPSYSRMSSIRLAQGLSQLWLIQEATSPDLPRLNTVSVENCLNCSRRSRPA
jgi:putative ABC transport system substrate-binding protein